MLAVTSCGVIPTPPVALPDVTLDLPASAAAQGRVIYLRQDALAGASLPSALQRLSLTGRATYRANGGTLRQVGVYVRSSLNDLPGTCTSLGAVVACEAAGEAAQAVGTLPLTPGVGVNFALSGAALDTAARGGHGYFGVRAVEGDSLAGEQVGLTDLQARARF
ncbi:hypothetical protein DAETH_17990 [Deinococcus aetherius]|uniref:Lipoprotein n=2 Tax=Deinococcus aetherius TaxID=200252 RepID=A0ABN6REM9_9DEIO|nr:hypothetical protein DAETH_17990 [Deinococcus aetherius]